MNLSQLTKDVILVCQRAGEYLLKTINDVKPELKGSNDFVTQVDVGSEKILLKGLATLCPQANFLSEEAGEQKNNLNESLLWVVDPLDGTVNYAFGIPFFAISVALIKEQKPILAVVYAPALNELFVGEIDRGSYLNNKRLSLDENKNQLLKMIATSAGMTESDFTGKTSYYHQNLLPHYNRLRLLGSQALHLCYVAAGRLEVALTNQAKLWDDAAGSLILQEASGIYSDFSGKEIFPLKRNSPVYEGKSYESIGSSSQKALDKIVKLLNVNQEERGII